MVTLGRVESVVWGRRFRVGLALIGRSGSSGFMSDVEKEQRRHDTTIMASRHILDYYMGYGEVLLVSSVGVHRST